MRVPLRNRSGDIVAWALCDDADAHLVAGRRWHRSSHGYARTTLAKNRHAFMHTLLMGARGVDHINGDKLDNRRTNLRVASQAQNMQNVSGIPTASSRYRGVAWHKKGQKWEAYYVVHRRRHYLGLFADEREAARVASEARAAAMTHTNEARHAIDDDWSNAA